MNAADAVLIAGTSVSDEIAALRRRLVSARSVTECVQQVDLTRGRIAAALAALSRDVERNGVTARIDCGPSACDMGPALCPDCPARRRSG